MLPIQTDPDRSGPLGRISAATPSGFHQDGLGQAGGGINGRIARERVNGTGAMLPQGHRHEVFKIGDAGQVV